MIEKPAKPATELHAQAPGGSVRSIINHYWRELCEREGIDPDTPLPSKPSRYYTLIKCQEGPNGVFSAVVHKVPIKKALDLSWINTLDDKEAILSPYLHLYIADSKETYKKLLTPVLNEMERDEIDLVVLPAHDASDAFIEALNEVLHEGTFAFSAVVVAGATNEITCSEIVVSKNSAEVIATHAAQRGIVTGLLSWDPI